MKSEKIKNEIWNKIRSLSEQLANLLLIRIKKQRTFKLNNVNVKVMISFKMKFYVLTFGILGEVMSGAVSHVSTSLT